MNKEDRDDNGLVGVPGWPASSEKTNPKKEKEVKPKEEEKKGEQPPKDEDDEKFLEQLDDTVAETGKKGLAGNTTAPPKKEKDDAAKGAEDLAKEAIEITKKSFDISVEAEKKAREAIKIITNEAKEIGKMLRGIEKKSEEALETAREAQKATRAPSKWLPWIAMAMGISSLALILALTIPSVYYSQPEKQAAIASPVSTASPALMVVTAGTAAPTPKPSLSPSPIILQVIETTPLAAKPAARTTPSPPALKITSAPILTQKTEITALPIVTTPAKIQAPPTPSPLESTATPTVNATAVPATPKPAFSEKEDNVAINVGPKKITVRVRFTELDLKNDRVFVFYHYPEAPKARLIKALMKAGFKTGLSAELEFKIPNRSANEVKDYVFRFSDETGEHWLKTESGSVQHGTTLGFRVAGTAVMLIPDLKTKETNETPKEFYGEEYFAKKYFLPKLWNKIGKKKD